MTTWLMRAAAAVRGSHGAQACSLSPPHPPLHAAPLAARTPAIHMESFAADSMLAAESGSLNAAAWCS